MRSLLIILILVTYLAHSQAIDSISVSTDKTVYVLFETDVSLVDLGTKLDYAYLVKENIVMLKALKENVKATSLMIKTKTDINVWIIKYTKDPSTLLVNMKDRKRTQGEGSVSKLGGLAPIADPERNTSEIKVEQSTLDKTTGQAKTIVQKEKYLLVEQPAIIKRRAEIGNRDVSVKDELMAGKIFSIFNEKKNFRDLGEIGNGIYFSLHDLCVDNQFIYIKMGLFNTSSIAFDLDVVYFERNQGKSLKKREAYSNTVIPIAYRESVFTVQPTAEEIVVFVLDLFAYQEKDKLMVKVNERGGMRSLQFFIPAKQIVNAKSL